MSINLIPWREERRKYYQKKFYIRIFLAILISFGILFLAFLQLHVSLDGQNNRLNYLQDNIDKAKKQITDIKNLEKQKAQLLSRKTVIEHLQANRNLLPHVFFELANATVDGIIFDNFYYKDKVLTIQGRTTSQSSVASFINNLNKTQWFKNSEIVIIQNKDDGPLKTNGIIPSKPLDQNPLLKTYNYIFIVRTTVENPELPNSDNDNEESVSNNKASRHKRDTL